MEAITSALAAGAAAGLAGVATQAIKDTYAALKGALLSRYPNLNSGVQALEAVPTSRAKQGSLTEDVEAVGAGTDTELMTLARVLLEAIEREAPQAATTVGVDLEGVKAEFVNVQRVTGGVRFRAVEATGGGINITDVRQAGGPDPNR